MKKPEILAPAGSKEAFLAAVAAKADAIYVGGRQFSARAYASNLDEDAMAEAIRYAHLRGVKVYVTVNTLIKEDEMAVACQYIATLYRQGVDGVILQDWGLISLVRRQLPGLPISGSTQMSLHNSAGVIGAAGWGLSRVILARETSLADMTVICQKSPIECEIFVHGALCICYSGQCLFSSMVGGRSGNRGRCAQPCRLPYTFLDREGKELAKGHLLSPKDFQSYDLLPELWAAGAASWKIEGRMKRPEYVAAVTDVYQRGLVRLTEIGEFQPSVQDKKSLEQAFNREFTTGYLLGREGKDLMSYQRPNNRGSRLGRVEKQRADGSLLLKLEAPLALGDGIEIWVTKGGRLGFTVTSIQENTGNPGGAGKDVTQTGKEITQAQAGQAVWINGMGKAYPGDRVFKTYDVLLMEEAKARYEAQELLPLFFTLEAFLGKPLVLRAGNAQGLEAVYESDFCPPLAEKHPADREYIEKQLGRLGGSGWYLADLKIRMDEGVMLPASVLNNARREAISALEDLMLADYRRMAALCQYWKPDPPKKQQSEPQLAVYVNDAAAGERAAAGGAQMIYIGGDEWQGINPWRQEATAALAQKCRLAYVLPQIASEKELSYWRQKIEELKVWPVEALVCGNVWGHRLAEEAGWSKELWGDLGLNIFNSQAGMAWQERGMTSLTLSPELNWNEIESLAGSWRKEALVHGNIQLMVSAHCPIGALAGGCAHEKDCSRPCLRDSGFMMQDEKGYRFPVFADKHCRMHLFNPHHLCLIDDLPRFIRADVGRIRLDLRFYPGQSVEKITGIYRRALALAWVGKEIDSEKAKAELISLSPGKLTKGHYYRGVE